jgi:hypothetical protein
MRSSLCFLVPFTMLDPSCQSTQSIKLCGQVTVGPLLSVLLTSIGSLRIDFFFILKKAVPSSKKTCFQYYVIKYVILNFCYEISISHFEK